MHPKDAEGIANSVDPDQTAPLGAVWSGSALFAQTCLSEKLGKLRYITRKMVENTSKKLWKFLDIFTSLKRNCYMVAKSEFIIIWDEWFSN